MKKQDKISSLARDKMRLSANKLIVNLRFIDMAISGLRCEAYKGTYATSSEALAYNPKHVLR